MITKTFAPVLGVKVFVITVATVVFT
jgi:hypothetical protein